MRATLEHMLFFQLLKISKMVDIENFFETFFIIMALNIFPQFNNSQTIFCFCKQALSVRPIVLIQKMRLSLIFCKATEEH